MNGPGAEIITSPTGAPIVTVGAEVYPVPAFVMVIAVTTPFVTVALAVAPLPPPPESVTVGTLV